MEEIEEEEKEEGDEKGEEEAEECSYRCFCDYSRATPWMLQHAQS